MAEREGFEPSVPVRVRVLSRDVPSATQPSFQYFNNLELVYSSKFFSSITLHIRLSLTKKTLWITKGFFAKYKKERILIMNLSWT